jgi:hypothetical protein
MTKAYSLALAAGAKRVSDVYGGTAGAIDAATDIPYRQLLLSTTGADGYIGGSSVSTTAGIKIATASTFPVSIGPFPTGAVKLSDLYAVGAGATLQILGVPF